MGAAYVLARTAGKLIGCRLGGGLVGIEPAGAWWLGGAMLPQAGVALGLTLLAADRFPAIADEIVPVVIVATVVFELVGPLLTGHALQRVGEAGAMPAPDDDELGVRGDDDPPQEDVRP